MLVSVVSLRWGGEYLTFNCDARRIELVEPLVDFRLQHQQPAVQESILRCLGHQRDRHPEFSLSKLNRFLMRSDIAEDTREYAEECKTGVIL